jgi:hypothetical protein
MKRKTNERMLKQVAKTTLHLIFITFNKNKKAPL